MMLVAMTSPSVAGYERNRDYERQFGEPGNSIDANAPGREPDKFSYPRQPVEGLRAVVNRFVHHLIPNVPGGPARVVADRHQGSAPGQAAHNPIRAASVYSPVPGVEQTAAWYDVADIPAAY